MFGTKREGSHTKNIHMYTDTHSSKYLKRGRAEVFYVWAVFDHAVRQQPLCDCNTIQDKTVSWRTKTDHDCSCHLYEERVYFCYTYTAEDKTRSNL